MIAFTAIGLLWFWFFCFEVGYHLVPSYCTVRALIVIFLLGREAERVAALITITAGVTVARQQTVSPADADGSAP